MTTQAIYQTLFNYQWHTTRRLLASAGNLETATYHENPGFGHGSIHDLFVHLLRAGSGWRIALETGQQQPGLRREDLPDLPAVKAGFETEATAWGALLEQLTDDQIIAEVTLTNWRGEPWTFPLWRVLQHLNLHAMQHHTELAQLLTAQGQSPGDIDFIFYRG